MLLTCSHNISSKMIKTVEGDMMHSGAEALVNTVNTVGVMGKGIALQFKEAFPNNSKSYIEQALSGLDTVIMIYEPNAAIKTILQKQETKRDVHLTPARAALLYTLFIFFLSFLIGEIFLLNLLIHQ